MSATEIARVVADLRTGRVEMPLPDPAARVAAANALAEWDLSGPVVDATALYRSWIDNDKPVALYEDHPCIAPPWPASFIGYQNDVGNVIVMVTQVIDGGQWATADPVDWTRVRWRLHTMIYLGGSSPTQGPIEVPLGPIMIYRYAIGAAGEPLDLSWVQPLEQWTPDMAQNSQVLLLQTLNFMNCRNVQLVEPQRPRAERRRVERTGVRVSTINVFPIGRSTRGAKADPVGVPLSSVRGHFARYGPDYDRGLLFGKYSGRFWHPQHARGAAEHGQVEHDYVMRP